MEVLNLDYFQRHFPGNALLYSFYLNQQNVLFITDCRSTQNHNHLDCKGTLNHIAKLAMFFLFLND